MNRRPRQPIFAFAALVAAGVIGISAHAQNLMTHHVPDAVSSRSAAFQGRFDSKNVLQLDIVLPIRNSAELDAFVEDVSDPASPSYRKFLTPAQFTERFGPSQGDYDEAVDYLTSHGLTVVGGTRDGMDIQVKGNVAAVERALHVQMNTYRHPSEDRVFYAPDREPELGLGIPLWHVSGLDNYSVPKPLVEKRSDAAIAMDVDSNSRAARTARGSGQSGSFLGSDMRAAYYGSGILDGTGQNVGLLEYVGTNLADVTTYYSKTGQKLYVTPQLLSVDGTKTTCSYTKAGGKCDDTEQTLDITQVLGMAPKLNSLVLYIGSTDTALMSAMTTHDPLPTTIGCSWAWVPVDPEILDPYFKKMAAQGQTFFAASGDNATWTASGYVWPADDPYVVSVGGTDLFTTRAGGTWASETAWVNSGGGFSPDNIDIPSWQALPGVINQANKGSSIYRNGPDVSANADYSFYVCSNQTACTANAYGGTSFAAPMWAGYIALVNQALKTNGKAPIGFINPLIYQQNASSSATFATDFHDITSGDAGSYSAVSGYDLVTGWGSPKAGLINTLASGTVPSSSFSLSASSASMSVSKGSSGSATLTTQITGNFNSSVSLTAVSSSKSVSATLSKSVIAAPGTGTATLKIAAPSIAQAGSYTVKVTATGNGVSQSTTITVVVSSVVKRGSR
jgi:subtilase family serine protease